MLKNNKRHFLWLVLIFIVPIVAAWIVYQTRPNLGLGTNHGELIEPPLSISKLKLMTDNGERLNNELKQTQHDTQTPTTNGKWMLLLFYPNECDQACQQGLYNLRQVRTATGKAMNRVRRALLTYPQYDENHLSPLLSQHFLGTLHLLIEKNNYRKVIGSGVLRDQFPHYAIQAGVYFIVDPNGNIMMSYRPGTKPESIYKDLKHLLKASQIG